MTICREKRGGRIYLSEYKSVREGSTVVHKFIRFLGREGPNGNPVRKPRRVLDKIDISGTVRYGDVAVMWALAEYLHFPDIIDKITRSDSDVSTGKMLTIWAINRALQPESATAIPQWIRRNALAELAGILPEKINKDRLLRALDDVCTSDDRGNDIYDYSLTIEKKLFNQNQLIDTDALAYDLTSTYFYGTTCPLARLGYNRDKKLGRLQIVIALAVTRKDRLPVFHQVYPGNTPDISTVVEFLSTSKSFGIKESTIIWDRVLTTENSLDIARQSGYQLIAGLPATRNDVNAAFKKAGNLDKTVNFVKRCGHGSLYGKSVKTEIFGEPHSVVVCLNSDLRETERGERNDALQEIQEKIDELSTGKTNWNEGKLRNEIASTVKGYSSFVQARVKRNGVVPRVEFMLHKHAIHNAELGDGRYAILHTDPSLTARQVVEEYHGKDFIEKVFRSLKQDIAIHPVRHRIPGRVRAYIFVCVLGYYLRALLAARLRPSKAEEFEEFLEDLAGIQQTTLSFGNSKSIRYLNLGTKTRNKLRSIGLSSMFRQVTTVEDPL